MSENSTEKTTEELFQAELVWGIIVGHGERKKRIFFTYEDRQFLMFTNGFHFYINECQDPESLEKIQTITLPKEVIVNAVQLYDYKNKFSNTSEYFKNIEKICR